MIFPMLVAKPELDKVRIINLTNEAEAVIDLDIFTMLVNISRKENTEHLEKSELDLLTELKDSMGIVSNCGIEEITIRNGELSNLEIYLTNSCNLRCKHCYFFEKGKHTVDYHLDLESLKKAIIDAEKIGMYHVKLCGGEPLCYDHMRELVKFINSRNISVTVITNGLLLNEYFDILDPQRVSLVVSLDGFEHSHDFLRGPGSFSITLDNIKKAISHSFDVTVNMVVYDKNANDIEEFTDFILGIGVRLLNVQVVRLQGRASEHLENHVIYDEDFLRKIHQSELDDQKEKLSLGKKFCSSYHTGLTINYDGSIISCPFLDDSTIGNLARDNIHEAYNRVLCENPLEFVEEKAACNSCLLFGDECAGGCRARAQKVVGSIYSCDYWIPFLLNHPKFQESPKEPYKYLLI
ncbi:MAG: radical SAM protein [Candidatus Electrothrix sp. AX2]|nr:radical SAM protein [Candidatus Electrothrix gigas]